MPQNDYTNIDWQFKPDSQGVYKYDQCQLAVLMDIRHELQQLNKLLQCPNFVGIPRTLKVILAATLARHTPHAPRRSTRRK